MFQHRHCILLIVLVFCVPARIYTQSASSKPIVARALWSPDLETIWGITESDFRAMGFGSLTKQQEFAVFAWAVKMEQKDIEAVPSQSFSCLRPGEPVEAATPESFDKVRLQVAASGDAPELISGIRERLRSMNGVEVVYSADEADLVVSVVTMEVKSEQSDRKLGLAASVVVSVPCIRKSGSSTSHIASVINQFLHVGFDTANLVNGIVSTIDTDNIEVQRQANADFKKRLQAKRK